MMRAALLTLGVLLLSACGAISKSPAPVWNDPDISQVPDAVPRQESKSRYGNPPSYVVRGKRYHVLADSNNFEERGLASWYGRKFHGRRTSSGETYDMYKMTAAHKSLPLPTYVEVTRVDNGKSVLVRVNDRGPFVEGRIIDLSFAAAERLGISSAGTAEVIVRAVGAASGTAAAQSPVNPDNTGTATAENKVYVQIGAFRDRVGAEDYAREVDRLALGDTRIDSINLINVGLLHKVRVGPMVSRDAARSVMMKLLEYGYEGFIVIPK